jgi:hypothetical protein
LLAFRRYVEAGHDDIAIRTMEYEQFCNATAHGGAVLGGSALGIMPGGGGATFSTPFNSKETPIAVKSADSLEENLPRKRANMDAAVTEVPKKNLFAEGKGDTSFMSQLGVNPGGTALHHPAATSSSVFIQGGDGKIILQHQPAVISNYKLFEQYIAAGWFEFIKAYRDESDRLPLSARRNATELVKHSVIEQLKDEFSIAHWVT